MPTRPSGARHASATLTPTPSMTLCTFGPGAESQAHAPNEITWKQDLVTCAALYAAVPGLYKTEEKTEDATEFRQSLTDNDIQ